MGDADVSVLARQPKRMALLAYLAVASPRGFHRRDKLIALFWPELDAAHARNSLSQTLHVIRSSLGADAIETRGDEIGLSPLISVDVRSFERALEQGDAKAAIAVYAGPLLDAFFVPSAPEFEEWLERERADFRRRACDAAWSLIDRSPASPDAERLARWATSTQFPDEASLRRLLGFLHARGNRSAAIQAYEAFVDALHREYAVGPSAATVSLAESIRATDSSSGASPQSQGHAAIPAPPQIVARTPRRTRTWVAMAALFVAVAGGAVAYTLVPSASVDPTRRLVIMPLANLGGAETAHLAASIGEELATRLASLRGLAVISGAATASYSEVGSSKAVRDPNTYLLEGSASWADETAAGRRVRVRLRIVRASDRHLLRGFVFDEAIASPPALFRLYSTMAQRVVNELDVMVTDDDWSTAAAIPTTNLRAYEDYLRGLEYQRRTQTAPNLLAAIRMFERAVEADSSFALAFAALGIVETNAHWLAGLESWHFDRARVASERALRLDSSLAEAHTSLAHYYYACCGDYERAAWHLSRSVALRPGDWQAVMFKGNVYKRKGAWTEAIAEYERAVELNPMFRWPLNNLGHAQMWKRDYDGAERTFRRSMMQEPQDPFAPAHLAWLSVLRDGSTSKARAVMAEAAPALEAGNDMRIPFYLDLVDRQYDRAIATLRPPRPGITRSLLDEWLVSDALRHAIALRLKGDSVGARAYFDSARVELEEARQIPGAASTRTQLWLRSALAIADAGLSRRAEALEHLTFVLRASPLSVDAIDGPKYLQHVALAQVFLGDHRGAISTLDTLLRVGGPVTVRSLAVEPFWDPLRTNAGFQRLRR
jgi:DNA-binding SARP family transcriptional activator/TolB-like protein